MKDKEYIRLGKGLKRGASSLVVRTRTSLWLGKDHLLCICNAGYTEEYRRFYYSDIQAVVLEKTARGKWINAALGLTAACAATVAASSQGIIAFPIFLSLTCLFSILLLINFLRGPTCMCRLYTAVSKEDLFSLDRSRKALRALELLRQKIEGVQGRITTEDISLSDSVTTGGAAYQEKHVSSTNGPAMPYGGAIHRALFYLLLADGVCTSFDLFFHHIASFLSMTMIELGLTVLVIIALIKQHESGMKGGLRSITWLTLAYVCLSYTVGYGIFVFMIFKYPQARQSQWEMLKIFAQLSPTDLNWLTWLYITSITVSTVAGSTGLVLLDRYRRRSRPSVITT